MIERRRTPRYSVRAIAEVVDAESGLRLDARAANMSLIGCYLATTDRNTRLNSSHIQKSRMPSSA